MIARRALGRRRAAKLWIGTALGLVLAALVLAFWIAPGRLEGVVADAPGAPSAQDPHDLRHLKIMAIADLRQHAADCADIEKIEPRGKEGDDTLKAAILCTSGEVYELRMQEKSPWEYRRVQ